MEKTITLTAQEAQLIINALENTPIAGVTNRQFVNALEQKIMDTFKAQPEVVNAEPITE